MEEKEPPPFLKTWKNVYFLVVVVELCIILLLSAFTSYFK